VVSGTANLLSDCDLRAVVRTVAGDGQPQVLYTGWWRGGETNRARAARSTPRWRWSATAGSLLVLRDVMFGNRRHFRILQEREHRRRPRPAAGRRRSPHLGARRPWSPRRAWTTGQQVMAGRRPTWPAIPTALICRWPRATEGAPVRPPAWASLVQPVGPALAIVH